MIERNVEALGVRDEVEVVRGDAVDYVSRLEDQSFDVVLADPPYDAGVEDALLAAVPSATLAREGCFVLQHRRTWQLGDVPEGLHLWRSKRFGDTVVDFLAREEEAG